MRDKNKIRKVWLGRDSRERELWNVVEREREIRCVVSGT